MLTQRSDVNMTNSACLHWNAVIAYWACDVLLLGSRKPGNSHQPFLSPKMNVWYARLTDDSVITIYTISSYIVCKMYLTYIHLYPRTWYNARFEFSVEKKRREKTLHNPCPSPTTSSSSTATTMYCYYQVLLPPTTMYCYYHVLLPPGTVLLPPTLLCTATTTYCFSLFSLAYWMEGHITGQIDKAIKLGLAGFKQQHLQYTETSNAVSTCTYTMA